MIISYVTIVIIAAVLGLSATLTFLFKKHIPVLPNWRILLFGTILSGLLFGFLLDLPLTEIYLLENKGSKSFNETIIYSYGRPVITLSDGEEIDTRELDLKMGKKYGFNASSSGMLFYSVVYTPASGIKLFGQNKEFDQPEPIFIESGCYSEVEEKPEYWFKEAPSTIETQSGLFETLFESMFNIGKIKWSVIPYTMEEVETVLIDAPDFNGMCLQSSNHNVSLTQLSKVANEITDTEVWLNKYMPEINNSSFAFTPGGNKASEDLKSKVPVTFEGKFRRTIDMYDEYNVIYYGDRYDKYEDFGVDPTLIAIVSHDFSQFLYSFDFSNFSVEKYSKAEDLNYTKISVYDVIIEDNVLYANIYHPTYSSSSSGYNAWLVAIDLETQKIKWITEPLTSNAKFVIDNDVIFTGYGFTDEDDFIYIIDKASGSRLKTVKIEKGPEFFTVKDGKLYVRTYSLDYVFQIER